MLRDLSGVPQELEDIVNQSLDRFEYLPSESEGVDKISIKID